MEAVVVIKLIKRYPLIGMIVGAMVMLGINIAFRQYERDKVQLSSLKEEQVIEKEESIEQVEAVPKTMIVEESEEVQVQQDMETTSTLESAAHSKMQPTKVPVYICGEITQPGVYYVASDAIIDTVISLAGGFTSEADQLAINLASPVMPNEKIIVPKEGEEIDKLIESYDNIEGNERVESTAVSPNDTEKKHEISGSKVEGQYININTADKTLLMTLPGIGEVKANAIISYRETQGAFASKEAIKNVSGIGEKTYEKIAQLITT